MRSTHSVLFGAAVVVAAFSFIACSPGGGVTAQGQAGGRGAAPPGGRGEGPAIPVTVGDVTQKAMPVEILLIGTAEASQTVAIRAQMTGELTAVNFKEGDDVVKGQVLFSLDRRALEATLAQARANLERDTAQATNAKASAARYQDLLGRGIATKEQADQSRTTATALEATLGADRAAIENAGVQLQYATIASPISGRTGTLMVHAGNLVRANDATPLVVINQVTLINISFGLPEGRLADLKRYLALGTLRVKAIPPGGATASSDGQISFIDNAIDQTTGTIKIKGSFRNADRTLWPGQFVKVTVTLTTDPGAIVVPTSAIQNGQQGQYVFVVKPDKTVEIRAVDVERFTTDETVIGKGLKPGETVVTDGQIRLVPGSRISVKPPVGARGDKATT